MDDLSPSITKQNSLEFCNLSSVSASPKSPRSPFTRRRSFTDQTPNALFYHKHSDGNVVAQRPTLYTIIEHGDKYGSLDEGLTNVAFSDAKTTGYSFGWIEGVYIRVTLSIFGVLMFLRLNWVMAQAGLLGGLGIIIWSSTVTSVTTTSLSAISTNGIVGAGGVYFMVSRSLGANFGAVVGLALFMAQSLAVALNLVGFAEAVLMLQDGYMVNEEWDAKIWALLGLVAMFGASFLGANFEVQSQKVLAVTMFLALLSFYLGVLVSDGDESIDATGLSTTSLTNNAPPHYTGSNSWVTVFGVYFPAVTGICVGSSISGDLANPQEAIPKGTFLSIITTTVVYISMAVLLAASFNEDGLANITTQICTVDISLFPPLVYAGVFAAGLSSALALLTGAPRVLMAVARDDILTFLAPWKKGYTANDEPVRGYLLVIVIALIAILTLDLNAVSPLVTNFYLVEYGCVNYAVAAGYFSKTPSWRPSFKYYHPWLSIFGCILCLVSMFMVDWITALATILVGVAVYEYVSYNPPDVNWGATTISAQQLKAVTAMIELEKAKQHAKTFRPNYLVLCGPELHRRRDLIMAMKLLRKARGLMIGGMIIEGEVSESSLEEYNTALSSPVLAENGIEGFKSVVIAPTLRLGAASLLQIAGLGKIKSNTAILGFKHHWQSASVESNEEYVDIIRTCFLLNHGVGIVRNLADVNDESTNDVLEKKLTTIDIWWLIEDGGLTLLLAYLALKHPNYRSCATLRVFSVASEDAMTEEKTRLEELLHKFRIEASVIVVPDYKSPLPQTRATYSSFSTFGENDRRSIYFMNISEQMQKYSSSAALVVASLPVPKRTLPVSQYMAYLELLSGNNRPTMLVRGNQETVLTFHS